MTQADLIEGCKRQDRQCQRRLYDTYVDLAIAVGLRYARDKQEAWDIVHDAFLQTFKYIEQFDAVRGTFESWFCKIVVNSAIKKYQKNRLVFPEEMDAYLLDAVVSPTAIADLQTEDLLRLLERLPDGYRLVFNLYIIEGYRHGEIADMLGITPSSVRSQLTRAKQRLQQLIAQQNSLEYGR
ncbi:MAG: sigma-70 family RNA polymerase sigma factor [Bacteroidota bacterium]